MPIHFQPDYYYFISSLNQIRQQKREYQETHAADQNNDRLPAHPFPLFQDNPHTLLKITFSDIRMLHEKASITGESAK